MFILDKTTSNALCIYVTNIVLCCDPNLGLMTKARACEGAGQE
jgi:hypothetical protein